MALDDTVIAVIIPVCAFLGLAFAAYLWKVVAKVQLVGGQNVVRSQNGREYLLVSGAGQLMPALGGGEMSNKQKLSMVVLLALFCWLMSMPWGPFAAVQQGFGMIFTDTVCVERWMVHPMPTPSSLHKYKNLKPAVAHAWPDMSEHRVLHPAGLMCLFHVLSTHLLRGSRHSCPCLGHLSFVMMMMIPLLSWDLVLGCFSCALVTMTKHPICSHLPLPAEQACVSLACIVISGGGAAR